MYGRLGLVKGQRGKEVPDFNVFLKVSLGLSKERNKTGLSPSTFSNVYQRFRFLRLLTVIGEIRKLRSEVTIVTSKVKYQKIGRKTTFKAQISTVIGEIKKTTSQVTRYVKTCELRIQNKIIHQRTLSSKLVKKRFYTLW